MKNLDYLMEMHEDKADHRGKKKWALNCERLQREETRQLENDRETTRRTAKC